MTDQPNILPISDALAMVDRLFSADRILEDRGQDRVEIYYKQSLIGYEKLYNARGAMHLALNDTPEFCTEGLFGQVRGLRALLRGRPVEAILELGSGTGFNLIWMAEKFPQARVMGVDLMPAHVARTKARAQEFGLPNMDARQGDFGNLPDDLGQFDLIYSIEASCYAQDLPGLFAQVAARLKPGGLFAVYDCFRNFQPADLPSDYARAMEIAEISMAVNHGFHTAPRWTAALEGAGLEVIANEDHTRRVMPCLTMLHERSAAMDQGFKKLALKVMPRYLALNGASGLTLYHAHAPIAGREDGLGPIAYRMIAARKPA